VRRYEVLADFNTAIKAFHLLPDEQKSPYLHPYYVITDALRDRDLEPVFFIYKDGGELFYYAFHLGKVRGTCFYDIQAPYAYGGPLSSTRDAGFLAKAWQHYFSWCQAKNILAEFVRFHPLLENWRYYPEEIQDMRETVWIDLQQEDLFPSYTTRVRTAIRKALNNGLRVEWVNDEYSYQTFVDLYAQAMNRLQADRFYYFPTEYFHKLQDWRQSYLAYCWKDEELLAAALFLKQAHIMEYHLSATSPEGSQLNATNLLLHQAAIMAREMGCRVLHLGGGTDNRADNPLLFFKSGFSRQRASFKIGKIIHAPEEYKKMQSDWQDRYGQSSDKTLFYRF
jgi:hypothetical protein